MIVFSLLALESYINQNLIVQFQSLDEWKSTLNLIFYISKPLILKHESGLNLVTQTRWKVLAKEIKIACFKNKTNEV
jgi:hypothetical protein